MNVLSVAIPILITVIPALIVVWIIDFWKSRSVALRRNNPLNRDLLRSPGESIREKIEELNLDFNAYLAMLMLIPLMLYSSFVSTILFSGAHTITTSMIVLYCLVFSFTMILLPRQIIAVIKNRRKLILGHESELAIGQGLNELIRDGAWVFHDFPADGFNIDHIVISFKGVLAIETKARSKPTDHRGKTTSWEVLYDGSNLSFPSWSENAPLDQAERQARWLQDWLTSAVGEAVSVKPILILPGWFIKRTNHSGVYTFNGKNPKMLLQITQEILSPELINRIVHQIDQRCRNIKPT